MHKPRRKKRNTSGRSGRSGKRLGESEKERQGETESSVREDGQSKK